MTLPPYAAPSTRPSSYLQGAIGDEVWHAGMHPALPEGGKMLDNPYQYTDYQTEATHGARGTMFGDPDSSSS